MIKFETSLLEENSIYRIGSARPTFKENVSKTKYM